MNYSQKSEESTMRRRLKRKMLERWENEGGKVQVISERAPLKYGRPKQNKNGSGRIELAAAKI